MATMTITITVNAKGVTWSRTASIDVDTAQYQQGNPQNIPMYGSEGTPTVMGQHSYAGVGVGFIANKGKGAVAELQFNTSAPALVGGIYLPTWCPFMFYAGGNGLTGAMNSSATATDLPDEDVNTVTASPFIGTLNTQSLAGLKAIS